MLTCYTWSPESAINLMDQITNSGPDALDPTTIDLDLDTPGVQSTYIIKIAEDNYTTISVDATGVVILHNPQEGPVLGFSGSVSFMFRIADDLGNKSTTGTVKLISDCS